MAHSKNKKVKQNINVSINKKVTSAINPSSINNSYPVWKFCYRDKEQWSLDNKTLTFDILDFLGNLENRSWNEILVKNKKQNHSIDVYRLNKCARDRLIELKIEASAIISLRVTETHRLYGYREDSNIFNIVWYDTNHGNNSECICRSNLKHT